ncbi:MAG: glycoside hydrolase family 16 protein [Saprospirales bacterium]|nr:glycoside hydrolase family 16 protein [Saprospirales bacterium]
MVWSDEFNADISPDNWNYELGDGTAYGLPPGWGNAERQLYTSSINNSNIQADGEGNSVLAIIAKKEPGNNKYSSAKLTTQYLHGFRFGRIEARIKVPEGRGLWPAFWLVGENATEVDWPGCGEVDIMEVIDHEPERVHCSAHYTNDENKVGDNTDSYLAPESLSNDYHKYRLDWTPTTLTFSMDDIMVNQVPIEDDMKEFLRSFYIIFNIAVGGNWPGDPDETTVFPQKMLVDWVRAYSKDDLNASAPPPLNIDEETIGTISSSLYGFAFNSTLNQFNGAVLKSYGAGGEPSFSASGTVIEGDSSLLLSYPGGNWGGTFFILDPTIDATQYAGGNLKFSLHYPAELADMEIKLESVSGGISLFLKAYTGVDVGNGFLEYTIPMSDFDGLDLTNFKIPFALWNPMNSNGDFVAVDILLDNVYFEE